MKKSIFCSRFGCLCITLASIVSFTSCEKPDENDGRQDDTVFALAMNEIEIPAEGGDIEIGYTVTNPVDGQSVSVQSECDWVYESDRKVDGKVCLTVDPNEENEDRVCNAVFSYGMLADTLVVLQKAKNEQTDLYSIEVTGIKETSITISVIPLDKEQTYNVMVAEKSWFDSLDEEAVFLADLEILEEYAVVFGQTLEEYLRDILAKGDMLDHEVTGLKSDTEYCIYVYSLSEKGEKLSDMYTESVKTEAIEKVDILFGINYQIDQSIVTMEVFPSDNEQTYIFDVVEKGDFATEEDLVAWYQQYFSDKLDMYIMFGLTAQDMLNDIASKGPDSYTYKKLKSEAEYIGFAIAINEDILFSSDLFTAEFRTEKVLPSDNKIEITVSDVTSTSARISIATTNDDQYTCGVSESSEWLGMSDAEIVDQLINGGYNLSSNLFEGNLDSGLQDLVPDTDYVVFAFGYLGGVATTSLVKVEFTTSSVNDLSSAAEKEYGDGILLRKSPEESGSVQPLRFRNLPSGMHMER